MTWKIVPLYTVDTGNEDVGKESQKYKGGKGSQSSQDKMITN